MIRRKTRLWNFKNKRINYAKGELKLMLLKGVMSNKNIDTKLRAYAYSKVILINRKYNYKNYTQTCSISGKSKAVWSFCNLNRHKLNELNRQGSLLSVKPVSW